MPSTLHSACLFVISVLLFAGCSLPSSQLPAGYSFSSLGEISSRSVFAADPEAERVALVRDGLYLANVPDGSEVRLSDRQPIDLVWSRDGESLVALFVDAEQSQLLFYDAAGQQTGSSEVAGRLTGLAWGIDGQLLGQVVRLQSFSFGTSLKALLLRWENRQLVAEEPLYDTTFKPNTVVGLGETLYRMLHFDLAPAGDQILYTRLYDPPVIRKSLKVFQRNLATGDEQIVYDLPLESGGSLWSYDSEALLLSDGRVRTFLYDPRREQVLLTWDTPGLSLAQSPVNGLTYIDGVLYRSADKLLELPAGPARFSGDGRHLLVASGKELLLYNLSPVR